jgi:hypothetical protein
MNKAKHVILSEYNPYEKIKNDLFFRLNGKITVVYSAEKLKTKCRVYNNELTFFHNIKQDSENGQKILIFSDSNKNSKISNFLKN